MWLGKELHDWLLIVPLAAARLVSEKLEILCPHHTAVSLSSDIVFGMLSRIIELHWVDTVLNCSFHMGTPAILLCISVE